MSRIEPMFGVAGTWGLPRDAAVTTVEADCVGAVHRRHAAVTALPGAVVVLGLARTGLWWWRWCRPASDTAGEVEAVRRPGP